MRCIILGEIRVSNKIFSKYKTIGSAINKASYGDRIIISKGKYIESIHLNKDIELVAEIPGEVEIIGHGITINGNVVVRGIKFIDGRTQGEAAVLINGGSPIFENCEFTSDNNLCLNIINTGTNPRFKSCSIFGSKENLGGITFEKASGMIEDCHIYNHGNTNIVIMDGANPTIKTSHIYGSIKNGIWISGDCQPEIDSCHIYRNDFPNVCIKDKANPKVVNCQIYDGKENGVYILDNGLGTFHGCDIHSNEGSNVSLSSNSHSEFHYCKLFESEGNGLFASKKANGLFSNCEFFGNKNPGIFIDDEANPVIKDSKIYNSTNGINVGSNGKGQFERCEIYNSSMPNVVIKEQGNPTLIECSIFDSQSNNVYVFNKGFGFFNKCKIFKSSMPNVAITSNGNPVFTHCEVYDSEKNGIYIYKGHGQINKCKVFNNSYPGIAISDKSTFVVEDCEIFDNNTGVFIDSDGNVDLKKCDIYHNGEQNILIEHAAGSIHDSRLYGAMKDSLVVNEQGNVTVHNTNFYDNAECGLLISNESYGKLINCKVYQNKEQGIYVNGQSRAELTYCELYRNEDSNVYVRNQSDVTLDVCTVRHSNTYGVEVDEEANVTLLDTKVYRNETDNYLISENSVVKKMEKVRGVGGKEETIEIHADEEFMPKSEIFNEGMQKLNSMIGLTEIKEEIKNFIMELQGRKKLESRGVYTSSKPTLHMMFTGSPGTGKTEVARIMAKLLYGMGMIESNKCVEADRSTIVAKYIGHTEDNMKRLVKEAMGGVLFIDEAYALANGGENDFGKEAVDVLIKAMEDNRDNLVVILAGYQTDMDELLKMNEGFKSRIPYTFEFSDYTPKELANLIEIMLEQRMLNCKNIKDEIEAVVMKEGRSGKISGNARWARNFVEQIVRHYHIRIGSKDEKNLIEELIIQDVQKAAGINKTDSVMDMNKQTGLQIIKEEALAELDKMIGLETVKSEIQRIMNYIIIEQKRKQKGLMNENPNLHMIFYGPPGTGKTTVARIIGKFLKGIGILSRGNFIEADRSTIVGKYIGHTEDNMKKLIDRSLGGVLFIDEAYALANGGEKDFGKEAIDVLIKSLEDHRDNLVVIMAGYEDEMQQLLDMNPGFNSRMPFRMHFNNYSSEEIVSIVKNLLIEKNFWMSEESELCLVEEIQRYADQNNNVFDGNARWARNLVEKIHMEQNNRLAISDDYEIDMQEIVVTDIQSALERIQ